MSQNLILNEYKITGSIKEDSIYRWIKAKNETSGCSVVLQLLKKEAVPDDPSILYDYFNNLLGARKRGLLLPESMVSDNDNPLILIYKEFDGDLLEDALEQTPMKEKLASAKKRWHEVCELLHFLHNRNIVHGHIRPDSFFVSGDRLYLKDFGYVPFLEVGDTNVFAGYNDFLAPEVKDKANVTPLIDQYAFAHTVLHFHPQIKDSEWYRKATDSDPSQRFHRMREVFNELQKVLSEPPLPSPIEDHKKPPPIIPIYSLTTNVTPFEGGMVTPNDERCREGKGIEVHAIARDDWQFDHWEGDISGRSNPVTIIMDSNKNVNAHFIREPTDKQEIIVSLSGKGDYRSISEAIRIARADTVIRVLPGLYSECLVIDKPLQIISEEPAKSIIDSGDSDCILMQTDYAIVRGFTIKCWAGFDQKKYAVNIPRGKLELEDCDITSSSLSCVVISGSTTDPVFRRCCIHNARQYGVFVFYNGKGMFEECDIHNNTKSGVMIRDGGNPTFRRCQIHDGRQNGVFVEKGRGKFDECDIFGNADEGVKIDIGGDPVIQRCKIHNGKKSGVLVTNGNGKIEKSSIYDNTGAGVEIDEGGGPTIQKCKINRNQYGAFFVSRPAKSENLIQPSWKPFSTHSASAHNYNIINE